MKWFGHMLSIGADRVAISFAFCDSIAAKCQTTWQGILQRSTSRIFIQQSIQLLSESIFLGQGSGIDIALHTSYKTMEQQKCQHIGDTTHFIQSCTWLIINA
ncbi:MAG: hypothetical protein ACI9R8_002127 [Candidatus Paceibacteria bacterium]|jgi:hypothetical protein